jgi:hypothetical protein
MPWRRAASRFMLGVVVNQDRRGLVVCAVGRVSRAVVRHAHLVVAASTGSPAQQGRGHDAPDGEQHGQEDQEPEAQLHGGDTTRAGLRGVRMWCLGHLGARLRGKVKRPLESALGRLASPPGLQPGATVFRVRHGRLSLQRLDDGAVRPVVALAAVH